MKVSVVISVFNEEGNIIPLCHEVYESLKDIDFELILVDDGSKDDTVAQIKSVANDRTKLLIFNRNYGQSTALQAGIDVAIGEYIVTMDGDGQNDPADIPHMLDKLEKSGLDVIAGIRAKRKDKFFLRK